MKLDFIDPLTQGEFHLLTNESSLGRLSFQHRWKDTSLTIAWNNGPKQVAVIDEMPYEFPEQSILPLMASQSFRFELPDQVIAWQYNRDFYCIVDHDKEVSCVGFLFYGFAGMMFIHLPEQEQRKIDQLFRVFIDEFQTEDAIQKDMLQMLLKRLIIILTRLAKKQYIRDPDLPDHKLDIIRQYNLLVESHYKNQHQVQFYASELHKSPKTLANLFALYNNKSPLAIIQERIIMQAKRLLIYTDKSAKEIAYELGFEDAAYFSNFFKKHTAHPPMDFRRSESVLLSGQ
jgi:AraC family transcriptional regulator, transcriptional activator of pobA